MCIGALQQKTLQKHSSTHSNKRHHVFNEQPVQIQSTTGLSGTSKMPLGVVDGAVCAM
jgi:hypothetical protein